MSQLATFNLDQFRVPHLPVTLPQQRKKSRPPQREYFLKGPIPLLWLICAMALPGKALHVGLVLWFFHGLKGSHAVTLSPSQLARFGIQRETARRGLRSLEDAKLVTVERSGKKSPRVTLMRPAASTENGHSLRSADLAQHHEATPPPGS